MYAGVIHGPFDIRYEKIEIPELQYGEVLVKVKYTGICGSDIPRVNGNASHFFPMIVGHEFSGTIVEVGEGVTNRKVGDKISGIPLIPCMKCPDCKRGNYSLCKHYSFIGSRRFGSMAEYVALPAINTVLMGEELSFEMGALFEPATVANHSLSCANYVPGKTVAIIGAGTIGCFVLQWCKIFGARKVVMLNRSKEKLERSKKFGADAVISTADEGYLKQVMEYSNGVGYDYVFETAGTSETVKLAFKLAANKANVCMVGTPKDDVVFSVAEWEQINRKEMYVTGAWMSYSAPFPGSEWEETAHFFGTKQLLIDETMFDQVIPLSQIKEAFALFEQPGRVKGKILIDSEL